LKRGQVSDIGDIEQLLPRSEILEPCIKVRYQRRIAIYALLLLHTTLALGGVGKATKEKKKEEKKKKKKNIKKGKKGKDQTYP
jgi:hypothetical protein